MTSAVSLVSVRGYACVMSKSCHVVEFRMAWLRDRIWQPRDILSRR